MYETVKIVNGYEIYRMQGATHYYYVNLNTKGKYAVFHTIKKAAEFCESLPAKK